MEFEAYLKSKKIDSEAFKQDNPGKWMDFEFIFMQMHPKSFTMQKLNLINGIRRKYPLSEEVLQSEKPVKAEGAISKMKPALHKVSKPIVANKPKKPGKPVIRPKTK